MRPGVVALLLVLSCCGDDDPPVDPLFPADYLTTFTEVRNCRGSGDHDLHNIRVLADPAALVPYRDREAPFPAGALLVKEEYDFADECEGEILNFTVMQKLPAGTDLDRLDWSWQKVGPNRRVLSENDSRCFSCHSECVPPDGYDSTCAVP